MVISGFSLGLSLVVLVGDSRQLVRSPTHMKKYHNEYHFIQHNRPKVWMPFVNSEILTKKQFIRVEIGPRRTCVARPRFSFLDLLTF